MDATLHVVQSGELQRSLCDCCGDVTLTAWGEVALADDTIAVYRAQWTSGHVQQHGACFDVIWGRWGINSNRGDRALVRLEHRFTDNGVSVMVRDAELAEHFDAIAATAFARSDVIGTPRAPQVFMIYDAIVLQDDRLMPLITGG